MIRFAKTIVASAVLLLATGAQAAALFSATGGLVTDHDPGNPVNLGNIFTVTANSKVTSLGFYTPTNLVGGGETVALYDMGGNLLASTFVAVPVNTPGQYFYQAIAPVHLTAGQQYVVVNQVGQNAWAYGAVTATGATFDYDAYAYGAALTFPTSTAGASGAAYFGPNLTLQGVPEPASWALMIGGFGIVGAATRRRRASAAIA